MMVYIIYIQLLLLRMTLSLSLSYRDMYCFSYKKEEPFVHLLPSDNKNVCFYNFFTFHFKFCRYWGEDSTGDSAASGREISFLVVFLFSENKKAFVFVYSERELFLARGSNATSECKIRKRGSPVHWSKHTPIKL